MHFYKNFNEFLDIDKVISIAIFVAYICG